MFEYFVECIEQLRVLSQAPQPILLSIGPLGAALISAFAPVVLDKLFGGPSSGERAAQGHANRLAELEGQSLEQRMELIDMLEEMILGAGANPNIFRLPRDGQPGNLEQFLGGIDFETAREIEQLQMLLGQVPTSTGVSQQLLGQSERLGRERRDAMQGVSSDLVQMLLARLLSGGGGGGASNPFANLSGHPFI